MIKEHHRDTTLFEFACSMRAQKINRQLAKVMIELAWQRCEQPPQAKTEYTLDQAKTKVDNAYDNYQAGRSEGYEKRNEQEQSGRRSKPPKHRTSP